MKLEELVASVGSSVQQAQTALEQAEVSRYLSYFTPDRKGGPLAPQTVSLVLPGAEEKTVELPLVALCSHDRMCFDQVTVSLNIELQVPDGGGSLEAAPASAASGGHRVELTFRREEPVEAVSRISDAAGQIL